MPAISNYTRSMKRDIIRIYLDSDHSDHFHDDESHLEQTFLLFKLVAISTNKSSFK